MKKFFSIFILLLGFAFQSASFAAPPERQKTEFKFEEQQFIYFSYVAPTQEVVAVVHQNDKEVFTFEKKRILDELMTILKMSVPNGKEMLITNSQKNVEPPYTIRVFY